MNIEIANRLVQYRKTRGLSQEGLAAALGLSRQAVSKWERAEASPDTDNLIALAQLYGVPIDTLLMNGEIPPVQSCTATVGDPPADLPAPPWAEQSGDPLGQPSTEQRQEQPIWQQQPNGEPLPDPTLRDNLSAHYRQLSPGARALIKLMVLTASIILFVAYCVLSWIFPPLREAYAPLCAIVYMLLGFGLNLWHPGWFIFLTIPVFYSFF